jgi:chemotaxis protein methyltransferase CheR
MTHEDECTAFLQRALPRLRLRWAGFRKVRRQVCKRLRRRLLELRLEALEQYRSRLEADPLEWAVLDHLCRITISRLYRDKWVFDFLGRVILPGLAQTASLHSRPIRCWSAGCASGEEVYTLKILYDLEVKPQARSVEIEVIGTDVDEAVLRRAERACFSSGSVKHAPAHWLDAAFKPCGQDYCVRPIHRNGITFKRQDIRSELPAGCFDLVLCRNIVFTYFEIELQHAILDRLGAVLRQGGYLVIGAHERLLESSQPLVLVPGCREVFRRPDASRRSRRPSQAQHSTWRRRSGPRRCPTHLRSPSAASNTPEIQIPQPASIR